MKRFRRSDHLRADVDILHLYCLQPGCSGDITVQVIAVANHGVRLPPLPLICPRCEREARWSTQAPPVAVPSPLTAKDRRLLKALRITAWDVDEQEG